jgi:thiol-disulfide isomerase/thioredoxin
MQLPLPRVPVPEDNPFDLPISQRFTVINPMIPCVRAAKVEVDMKRTIGCALLLLMTACTLGTAQSKHVPNLEFQSLTGSKEKIGDLRGSIAVVNFWATWCGPCRQEFPMLSGLARKYQGKVRFISISVDNDPTSRKQRAKIDEFLTEQKPSMEIWVGGDLDALEHCGLGDVLPGTMILDTNGQIISRVDGQAHEEDITGPIEWALSGEQGPAPAAVVKRY